MVRTEGQEVEMPSQRKQSENFAGNEPGNGKPTILLHWKLYLGIF